MAFGVQVHGVDAANLQVFDEFGRIEPVSHLGNERRRMKIQMELTERQFFTGRMQFHRGFSLPSCVTRIVS
jgi:hypothetical protein